MGVHAYACITARRGPWAGSHGTSDASDGLVPSMDVMRQASEILGGEGFAKSWQALITSYDPSFPTSNMCCASMRVAINQRHSRSPSSTAGSQVPRCIIHLCRYSRCGLTSALSGTWAYRGGALPYPASRVLWCTRGMLSATAGAPAIYDVRDQ